LSDYTQDRHPRRERGSSARDGKLKSIHGVWIHTGLPALYPDGVNANPLPADLSGNPCRNDDFGYCVFIKSDNTHFLDAIYR